MTWLSYKSAAKYCETSVRTIRKWVAEGELRIYKIGGIYRLKADDIDDLFEGGIQSSELEKFSSQIDAMIVEMR